MADKTWGNIQESKELDETQGESTAFHRRFAAGSSIIASDGRHLSLITEKKQEKAKSKGKKQKPKEIHPDAFKEIIQDSGYNHSESKQLTNLSSYDFSSNSEVFPSWKEQIVKQRKEPKDLKPKEFKNSEKTKKISDPTTFLEQAEYEQFQSNQDLTKIQKIRRNLNKVRCSVLRLSAETHLTDHGRLKENISG